MIMENKLRGSLARNRQAEVPEFTANELARLIQVLEQAAEPALEDHARRLFESRLQTERAI